MLTVEAGVLGNFDETALVEFVSSRGSDGNAPLRLDAIEAALDAFRRGRPVVVIDDEDRENEGDLIVPACAAEADVIGFMTRWTSGLICVAMTGDILDRLRLPPMTAVNQDPKSTAYAVSVDSCYVESTGISAVDRACTIRALADSSTDHADLTRPGHVVPLRAVAGGVLQRRGHTEAAVDLAELAGLPPAGALAELTNDDGTMMRAAQCREFADEHGLAMISIADLARYRWHHEQLLERTGQIPQSHGEAAIVLHRYRSVVDGREHHAVVVGDLGEASDVPIRVQTACVFGPACTIFGCGCVSEADAALDAMRACGAGVIVYIGAASSGEVRGLDCVDPALIARQVLSDLGLRSTESANSGSPAFVTVDDLGLPVYQESRHSRLTSISHLKVPA